MLLSDKVYGALKWTAQYLLPATGTLYFALASIWGFPYGEEVVGTISALTIFLGVILGVSTNTYIKSGANIDGTLQIDTQDPSTDVYRLQLNTAVENLSSKQKVTFLVDPNAKLSE